MLQRIALLRQTRKQLGGAATVEDLADASGMPVEQVAECLEASRLTRPESWNETVHGRSFSLSDGIAGTEQEELRQVLADGIESLADTMRVAVSLHYMEGLKLREVGDVLGLSESRVCRIVNSARERLQDYVRQRDCGAA